MKGEDEDVGGTAVTADYSRLQLSLSSSGQLAVALAELSWPPV